MAWANPCALTAALCREWRQCAALAGQLEFAVGCGCSSHMGAWVTVAASHGIQFFVKGDHDGHSK